MRIKFNLKMFNIGLIDSEYRYGNKFIYFICHLILFFLSYNNTEILGYNNFTLD